MNRLRKILLSIFLLKSTLVICQGLPPVQNFSPVDYSGENQNWSLSQTSDKHIYVSNNEGLLEYNGSNWTLYPSPNGTIIRSVKVFDDKIFTGCYMEFGYWKKDNFGILQYTSLSENIKNELLADEEFWSIIGLDDWVVFRSTKRIYVYNLNNNSFYPINVKTSLPRIFKIDQNIYFHRPGKGIYKIETGKDLLAIDDAPILNDEVAGIFGSDKNILVLTRHKGFYKPEGDKLVKWKTNSDPLLSTVSTYSSLQLRDESFVLGTISDGLIHLDKDGNLINQYNQTNGLQNNTVLSLLEDIDGNIWLGLDSGISNINLKSPFKVYQDNRGILGSVYTSLVKENILYLGSNQGLFYKEIGASSDFEMIPGTEGQVWSLNNIDGTVFCAHHKGTYIIEGAKAEKIVGTNGTWIVREHWENPSIILQGNYDGLYILAKTNNDWELKNKIGGFNHSAKHLELYEENIFVSHEYKGVFKIQVDSALRQAESVALDTTIRGSNSGLAKYKEDLFYAYRKGIFKYDPSRGSFIKDSLLGNVYSKDEYVSGKMVADNINNYLWIFTEPNITYVAEGKLGNTPRLETIPLSEDMRNGVVGYESAMELTGGNIYLLGSNFGYITVDINKLIKTDFAVGIETIRRVGKGKDDSESDVLDKSAESDLKSNENNLEFSLFAAQYGKFKSPEFQYQLSGYFEEWSNWSRESTIKFENLPPGEYSFKARARIGGNVSSNIASHKFNIDRPWYLSNFMQFVYVVLALIGSFLVHRFYKNYYDKQQAKLIEANKREMDLAKAENEREIIRLKNEQLKAEYNSKSKELAASTMGIIKKNELLSRVKDQLMANFEETEKVLPIINTIDKSLKQNDDWELFKEAFNNADQKFLKKLKKVHPNLSPNDIKLCAYLRLNLSSKEIAPLLSISARSVEIKRYRLRKKMGLVPDDNLVKYILEL